MVLVFGMFYEMVTWMLLAFYFLMIELIYIVLSGSPWERYRELLQKHHTVTVVLISLESVEFVSTYINSTLNPNSYLLLFHTYWIQGGTPVWCVNWTSDLSEILLDSIHSRRATWRKHTKNIRHDQLKMEYFACSTYQQILKAYTK